MAQDIRLLQHDRFIEEPFGEDQIGSSAMAYKRNPMRCERICSLARYLMTLPADASMTAATQFLERTLDDSAGRRIVIPEAFLCADAVLRLACSVISGLTVNEKVIDRTLREYLPFMATENILMEGVRRGGDRQELHEHIRRHSMEAVRARNDGKEYDLLGAIADDDVFRMTREELADVLDPALFTGRSSEQVTAFLDKIKPLISGDTDIDYDIEV